MQARGALTEVFPLFLGSRDVADASKQHPNVL
jgi:hypothetical protein